VPKIGNAINVEMVNKYSNSDHVSNDNFFSFLVNWARRNSCNMCNVPRFSEVEQRTGYGGGFNEREKVEYKERGLDDDEFDEFGRRKKQRRHSNSPPQSNKSLDKEATNRTSHR
jgi:hypothetical protein